MPQLSAEGKTKILYDISMKMSFRSIGDKYKISHTTVSRLYKKFCNSGETFLFSKSGKKKKLQSNEILRLKRISNDNPFMCGRQVRDEAGLNYKISIPTTNRYLRCLGLFGRISRRINYHTPSHMYKRRQFCKDVKTWNFDSWRKVVFTDEVRFELESRRRMFVRRPVGARNRTKYCLKWKYYDRRSLMFWGLICADGRREIVCCEGSMDSVKYCNILDKSYVTRYANKILQQDNASCHCSKFTKEFLKLKKINVLQNYPPCSPDLNIIENIWAILKNNVRRRAARNLAELNLFVEEEFHKIPDSIIINLYRSIPMRILQVIRDKGA